MGHTQTTQSNNNRPYVLVRARIHVYVYVLVYARLKHIKRAMQEPGLPSDKPSMTQVARLQYSAAGWTFGCV